MALKGVKLVMTSLLEEAIKHVEQLPPSEQDVIASLILAELDERRTSAFAKTHDQMTAIAPKRREDMGYGRT